MLIHIKVLIFTEFYHLVKKIIKEHMIEKSTKKL